MGALLLLNGKLGPVIILHGWVVFQLAALAFRQLLEGKFQIPLEFYLCEVLLHIVLLFVFDCLRVEHLDFEVVWFGRVLLVARHRLTVGGQLLVFGWGQARRKIHILFLNHVLVAKMG